jgi:hypothetical protein
LERGKKPGFDGVMIHGARGFPVSSFLMNGVDFLPAGVNLEKDKKRESAWLRSPCWRRW